MVRRASLVAIVGVLIVVLALFYVFGPDTRKPALPEGEFNILLISIDSLRADHFAFNGHPGRLAPNIERLAESGAVFRRAYCYAGSTPPSMAAIFTGKFPYWPLEVPGGTKRWAHEQTYGLTRFFEGDQLHPGFPETLQTLPTILRRHDYTNVGISTNPNVSRDFHFDKGFDFFEQFLQINGPAEKVGDRLRAYLSKLKGKKFFAWGHFMDVHWPLLGNQPFRELAKRRGYWPRGIDRPVSEWPQIAKNRLETYAKIGDPNWVANERNLLRALEDYRLAYAGQIARADKEIGKILDTLREYRLWESTLIIIMSDHGDEFLEHGDFIHTGQLYEEIIRGVWVMHNPTLFPRPRKINYRVSLVDFVPTLLDLLDLPMDGLDFDGNSRLPLLEEPNSKEDGTVHGLLDQRAYVIDGDYKLIVNNDFGQQDHGAAQNPPAGPLELYNLSQDPGELNNLATKLPGVVNDLYSKLEHAFLKKGIQLWADSERAKKLRTQGISEETKERLKALGYVH